MHGIIHCCECPADDVFVGRPEAFVLMAEALGWTCDDCGRWLCPDCAYAAEVAVQE